MKSTIDYASRISLFSSVGYLFATGYPTIIDPLLTTHVLYGARTYPLGYWIFLFAPLVYIPTYYLLKKKKYIISLLPLVIANALSLFNFFPEFPHAWIILLTVMYTAVAFISNSIHFANSDINYVFDISIDRIAKIERLKSSISLWRTIAISIGGGYLALLMPAATLCWSAASYIATKQNEIFILQMTGGSHLAIFSLYVLVAPVIESLSMAEKFADGLLLVQSDHCDAANNRNNPTTERIGG